MSGNRIYHIAIDGPSGAGKSTVARNVAKKLGIAYLDTGAMYRAVGLYMQENGVEMKEGCVCEALPGCKIEVDYDEAGGQRTLLNGRDVSEDIRRHCVSRLASAVSAFPCVREHLVALQREIAQKRSFVLDGRDICKYVLPQAEYKFFLTASAQERARRRCEELKAKGETVEPERVLKDIVDRDYADSHRAVAPLEQAEDAVVIDSTEMSIDAVTERILAAVTEEK